MPARDSSGPHAEPSIDELKAKIAAAIAELDRGEGVPLDIEDLKQAGRQRLLDPTSRPNNED